MGWFWAAYSFGIGVFGAYLPSFTIPLVGEYYSLWLSLPFSIAGLLICLLLVPKSKGADTSSMSNADKLRELSRGATILVPNLPNCIGCGGACDLQSDVVWLSRHHAALLSHYQQWWRSLV